MGQACCACDPRGHLRRRHRRGHLRACPRVRWPRGGPRPVSRSRSSPSRPARGARCSPSASWCPAAPRTCHRRPRPRRLAVLRDLQRGRGRASPGSCSRPARRPAAARVARRLPAPASRHRWRGGLVIATGAALTVAAFDGGEFLTTWPQVFASHAASTLVIAPVAMSLRGGTARRRTAGAARPDAGPVRGHGARVRRRDQTLPLAFAPLPLLVWAALRHDVRVVAWQLLGVSVLCTLLTAAGPRTVRRVGRQRRPPRSSPPGRWSRSGCSAPR